MLHHRCANFRDLGRQRAAIRIAEHQARGTAVRGGLEGGQRVLRGVLVAIEKVLRIVDHLAAVLYQMGHGVADHRLVFRHRGAQDFGDLQFPAFSENRHHRRLRLQQQPHLRILFHCHTRPAGGTEGGQLGMLELQVFRLAEELDVLGIRARPAAFDVVDAEFVKPLRDPQLVEAGKLESFPLRAIAQGRVVEKYRFGTHSGGSAEARSVLQNGQGGRVPRCSATLAGATRLRFRVLVASRYS